MLSAEFEPAIPAKERPQTHALDRATTGTGDVTIYRSSYLIVQRFAKGFRHCKYFNPYASIVDAKV
jgi:hypothetical protein